MVNKNYKSFLDTCVPHVHVHYYYKRAKELENSCHLKFHTHPILKLLDNKLSLDLMIHVNLTVGHIHLTPYLARSCHEILHRHMFFFTKTFFTLQREPAHTRLSYILSSPISWLPPPPPGTPSSSRVPIRLELNPALSPP